jgi:hypothetical protein
MSKRTLARTDEGLNFTEGLQQLRRDLADRAFHPRNGGRDQRSLAGMNSGFGVVSGIPDAIIIKGGITYGLSQAARTGLNRVGAAGTCLCIINRGATKTCNPRPPKANEGARLFGR